MKTLFLVLILFSGLAFGNVNPDQPSDSYLKYCVWMPKQQIWVGIYSYGGYLFEIDTPNYCKLTVKR